MKNNQLEKAHSAVKTIADKEGVSVDNVREEIKAAMSEGLRSPDPAVQEMWKSIPCKGEAPEPEELIAWLAEQVREKLKK